MDIVIKQRAMHSMENAAAYVEGLNTAGSGSRWLDKVKEEIETLARSKTKLALCKHASLAKFKYRCFFYHDWVVAYRISNEQLEVCRFIWGARLA